MTISRNPERIPEHRWVIPLVAAIVVIGLALAASIHRRRASLPHVESASKPNTDDSAGLLAVTQSLQTGPVHMSEESIQRFASTVRGRALLCQQIGAKWAGLDDSSLDATESALLKQSHIESVCLEALIRRLDDDLVDEESGQKPTASDHRRHNLARQLLVRQPQDTAALLRTTYALGGRNANPQVLPILEFLRLQTSCEDIGTSLTAMKNAADPDQVSFGKSYREICK
jgi:hypothetical protein